MASSEGEREALRELQERLRDVAIPEEIRHRVYLLKFLKARDFDVDRAEKMFRAHLEWREKWRPEYLRDEWKAPPLLERYGAFGFLGYDLEGSAVFLVDQGGTDLKGILSCISKEDYMRWGIQIAEKGLLEGRRSLGNGNGNGNGNGPAYQFVFIVDLHGWNFSDVFFKPVLDTVLGLMQMQEANYPEYLKRIYVLNLPWFFAMFLGLVKQFLRQATQEKIVCLGSKEQYEPVLTQAISKEVLPKFWGGERVDEDGDPRCSSLIGKGGKVPRSLYRTGRDAKEEAEMEEEKGEC